MLVDILIVVAVLFVVFAIIVSMRPADFRVARSASVSAPPAVVFPHVNNLRNWAAWNPWTKLDPEAKMTYEGPDSGAGASYTWSGNNKVGAGRMTITESHADDVIRFKLEFQKPFKATNSVEFTFKVEGGQTVVTWDMRGTQNFVMKAMGLFMDCDKMCGDQFNKGLADLKNLAEADVNKAVAATA